MDMEDDSRLAATRAAMMEELGFERLNALHVSDKKGKGAAPRDVGASSRVPQGAGRPSYNDKTAIKTINKNLEKIAGWKHYKPDDVLPEHKYIESIDGGDAHRRGKKDTLFDSLSLGVNPGDSKENRVSRSGIAGGRLENQLRPTPPSGASSRARNPLGDMGGRQPNTATGSMPRPGRLVSQARLSTMKIQLASNSEDFLAALGMSSTPVSTPPPAAAPQPAPALAVDVAPANIPVRNGLAGSMYNSSAQNQVAEPSMTSAKPPSSEPVSSERVRAPPPSIRSAKDIIMSHLGGKKDKVPVQASTRPHDARLEKYVDEPAVEPVAKSTEKPVVESTAEPVAKKLVAQNNFEICHTLKAILQLDAVPLGKGTVNVERDMHMGHKFLTIQLPNGERYVMPVASIVSVKTNQSKVMLVLRDPPAQWMVTTQLPYFADALADQLKSPLHTVPGESSELPKTAVPTVLTQEAKPVQDREIHFEDDSMQPIVLAVPQLHPVVQYLLDGFLEEQLAAINAEIRQEVANEYGEMIHRTVKVGIENSRYSGKKLPTPTLREHVVKFMGKSSTMHEVFTDEHKENFFSALTNKLQEQHAKANPEPRKYNADELMACRDDASGVDSTRLPLIPKKWIESTSDRNDVPAPKPVATQPRLAPKPAAERSDVPAPKPVATRPQVAPKPVATQPQVAPEPVAARPQVAPTRLTSSAYDNNAFLRYIDKTYSPAPGQSSTPVMAAEDTPIKSEAMDADVLMDDSVSTVSPGTVRGGEVSAANGEPSLLDSPSPEMKTVEPVIKVEPQNFDDLPIPVGKVYYQSTGAVAAEDVEDMPQPRKSGLENSRYANAPEQPAMPPHVINAPCKYGDKCRNGGCNFVHPADGFQPMCKFHPNCNNPGCAYSHPKTSRGSPLCKYAPHCRNAACTFEHPESDTPCKFNPCMNSACAFKHVEGQQRGVNSAMSRRTSFSTNGGKDNMSVIGEFQKMSLEEVAPKMKAVRLQDANGNWIKAYVLEEAEDEVDSIAPLGQRNANFGNRSPTRSPSRRSNQSMPVRDRLENSANRGRVNEKY